MSKRPELARGDNVAIALQPGVGIGLARDTDQWFVQTPDPLALLAELNDQTAPRWVWWDRTTATQIAQARVPIDRCWDVATVHRLIFGGWKTSVGEVWASLNGLPLDTLPRMGQLGLLDMPDDNGDRDSPIQPDGHLRPEWISGGSQTSVERLASWASLVLRAMRLQQPMLDALPDPDRATPRLVRSRLQNSSARR